MKILYLYKQLFLTALLSLTGTSTYAQNYDIAVKNDSGVTIYYKFINDGNELEVVLGNYCDEYYEGVVNIPNIVTYMKRARKVTSIGEKSFDCCYGLKSVTIPNSVKSIGDNAFCHCVDLTSVTIGNSVTSIGERAFYGCCSLSSITIPNSVTTIGEYAFERGTNCGGSTNVTITNSVTNIGIHTFEDCKLNIIITNSVSGNTIKAIAEEAMKDGANWTEDVWKKAFKTVFKAAKPMLIELKDVQERIEGANGSDRRDLINYLEIKLMINQDIMEQYNAFLKDAAKSSEIGKRLSEGKEFQKEIEKELGFGEGFFDDF